MYESALLNSLGSSHLSYLEPLLAAQRLSPLQVLRREGDRASDVYFVDSGLVSLMSGGVAEQTEIALIGREGMVGASALLGAQDAPSSAVVRVGGLAWRISRRDLANAMKAQPNLRRRLLTYVNLRMHDATRAIISASRCTVEQRVAGWLLRAHDRLQTDELPITHDVLAQVLSVRRPGVTVAVHVLEGTHSIAAKRGRIMIRSRDALKHHAGSAYRPAILPSFDLPAPTHSPVTDPSRAEVAKQELQDAIRRAEELGSAATP